VRFVVFVLALVLVSAASAGRSSTGVLRGTVTRGPITPVCSDTHACSVPAARVRIAFLRNGHTVGRTTTRADGSYRVGLPAGRCVIRLRDRRHWSPTRVLVRGGRITRVDIAIDTGIR
jgi:hypothetical protein